MKRFVLVALVACKSTGIDPTPAAHAPEAGPARLRLPRVTAVDAVAAVSGPTPVLLFLDDAGHVSLAAGPTWDKLGGFDPAGRTKPVRTPVEAQYAVLEGYDRDLTPEQVVAAFGRPSELPQASAEDHDEAEHTPIALDEGRMGKHTPTPPETDRQKHARLAGGFGRRRGFSALLDDTSRRADVVGEVTATLASKQVGVVLASPQAKATALIELLAETEALVGVWRGETVAPLRIQFLHERDAGDDVSWTSIEVSATRAELGGQAFAWTGADFDGAALEKALAATKRGPWEPVDVLVTPDVDVQHLVDVLAALEHAGVNAIGLGSAPTPKR